MANPQKENGYIPVSNEIADALMKVNLSAYESRVLWFLFRKTYGWNKKVDWITLSQFSSCTGLDRRLVHRALKGLSSKKMIIINRDDRFKIRYGFQKDYGEWALSSKEMTVIDSDDKGVIDSDDKVSSIQMNNKRHYTKDTITKERNIKEKESDFEVFWKAYPNKTEKKYTLKCWKKLNSIRPPIEELLEAIRKQTEWREKANGEFRPEWKNPATWLNKGCWEDELKTGGNGNARTTTNFGNKHGSGLSPEQEREADAINAEYYRRKAIEATDKTTGNT